MNVEFPDSALRTATRLLKMMSNPSRLLVLCELLDGEKSVGELERVTALRQSALSQHLAKLRSQGLVATRRQSQNIFYSLADTDVDQIIGLLHRLFCKQVAKGGAKPKEGGNDADRRVGRRTGWIAHGVRDAHPSARARQRSRRLK